MTRRPRVDELRASAGTGTVAGNLTTALTDLFGPVPLAIIPLITFNDGLRERLRQLYPHGGVAILANATSAVSAYLQEERRLGRVAQDTDIDSLTLSLVGGGQLLLGAPGGDSNSDDDVGQFVSSAVGGSAI